MFAFGVEEEYNSGRRILGRCKIWTAGHGFLKREDGGRDVFVHRTQLQKSGHLSLRVGDLVEFEVERKLNGKVQAVRVTGPFVANEVGQESPDSPIHSGNCIFSRDANFSIGPGDRGRPTKEQQICEGCLVRRLTGYCRKWVNGFGFIKRSDGEADVFVHQSQIRKQGYRTLLPGEPLEFEVVTKSTGQKQAVRVTGPGGVDVIGGQKSYKETMARQQDHLFGLQSYIDKHPLHDESQMVSYPMENVVSSYKSQHYNCQRSSCRDPYNASEMHTSCVFQPPKKLYDIAAARNALKPKSMPIKRNTNSSTDLYNINNDNEIDEKCDILQEKAHK